MRKTPLALPALVLLASCSGGGETPLRCAADSDCGAPGEAYCRAGSCIANGAPRVTVRAPAGALQTNVLLRFDGTAADPEGEALTLRWTATPLSGGCAGDADAATDAPPSADVALWCAGTYEVALAARDPWGHEGVARATVAVAQAAGAPTVSAGTGYAVDHACAGDPLRCDALVAGGATQLPLSASASSPGGGVLSYEWRALAPGGAEAAVAEFLPGPDAKSPAVSLHSAGTRLAGAWTMRVRARNEAGLLAQAAQVVTVSNRPPALSLPASIAADHVHDGSGYRAEALVAPAVADPDGDPVGSSFALSASAAHPCTHGFSPLGPNAAQLTLSCADPAQLIGTVAWGVHAVATDVNGATAEGDVSLEVRNRPPALRLGTAALPSIATVSHAVGPCAGAAGNCFTTAGEPAVDVVDPDGDPLEISAQALGADPAGGSRGTAASDAAGAVRFRFEADLDRPDLFRGADGSSAFSVQVSATDVFGATAAGATAIAIANQPPEVTVDPPASVPHVFDGAAGVYRAAAIAATFSDPDGDPLVLGDSGDAHCASQSLPDGAVGIVCSLPYVAGTAPPLATLAGTHALSIQVQDPWDLSTAATSLAVADAAPIPALPYAELVPTSCRCECLSYGQRGCEAWGLAPTRSTLPVDIRFAEPEGDPVRASLPYVAETICFEGACSLDLPGGRHLVLIDDGAASATVDVTVSFTCVDPPICG